MGSDIRSGSIVAGFDGAVCALYCRRILRSPCAESTAHMITQWQLSRMLIIIVSGGDAYSIVRDDELSLTSFEIAWSS